MFGGQRNLESEKAVFTIKPKEILAEFSRNIDLANKKYVNKPIEISGVVTSTKNNQVIIDNVVVCSFYHNNHFLKVDQNVSLKGRVVGFDDLMGELQLDKCILNKN